MTPSHSGFKNRMRKSRLGKILLSQRELDKLFRSKLGNRKSEIPSALVGCTANFEIGISNFSNQRCVEFARGGNRVAFCWALKVERFLPSRIPFSCQSAVCAS